MQNIERRFALRPTREEITSCNYVPAITTGVVRIDGWISDDELQAMADDVGWQAYVRYPLKEVGA